MKEKKTKMKKRLFAKRQKHNARNNENNKKVKSKVNKWNESKLK